MSPGWMSKSSRALGDDDLSLGADLDCRGVLARWGRLIHVHADLLVGATSITSGTIQEVTSRHVVDQRVRSVHLTSTGTAGTYRTLALHDSHPRQAQILHTGSDTRPSHKS